MRLVYAVLMAAIVSVVVVLRPDSAHVQIDDEIGPRMLLTEELDLDVFVEGLNHTGLRNEIEDYLDNGWSCRFLSTALEEEYGNGDRLYKGCVAFQNGSDWDAIKWDYDYDASSSQGTPSIPDDSLTFNVIDDPTGTEGLSVVLPNALAWDYVLYVGDNLPNELVLELSSKDLKALWVEHDTGTPERMNSFWKYEGGSQSKTIRVWSTVTNGEFGSINVN